MYYIVIPLRYLSEPDELNVPEDQRLGHWQESVNSIRQDIARAIIPSWAVDYKDLRDIELVRQDDPRLYERGK